MHEIEKAIAELFRESARDKFTNGHIECFAYDEGVGYSTTNFKILGNLTTLLSALREQSRKMELGPWYISYIDLKESGEVTFQYFWENAPITSIKDIQKDQNGMVPRFAFKKLFDKETLEAIQDFDVCAAVAIQVELRHSRGEIIPQGLMEIFAIGDCECDTSNGGLNQYFGRERESNTKIPRSQLYLSVLRGLKRIGHQVAYQWFSEAIAIYAHFYPRVEEVRKSFRIPRVPRTVQSDLMDRYWDFYDEFDSWCARYIRENYDECMKM